MQYTAKCEKFIENYAEIIISLLLSVPPNELCSVLNFCRNSMESDTEHHDILECSICNAAVGALSAIYSFTGPKDQKTLSRTTCDLLPLKHKNQVGGFVELFIKILQKKYRFPSIFTVL